MAQASTTDSMIQLMGFLKRMLFLLLDTRERLLAPTQVWGCGSHSCSREFAAAAHSSEREMTVRVCPAPVHILSVVCHEGSY